MRRNLAHVRRRYCCCTTADTVGGFCYSSSAYAGYAFAYALAASGNGAGLHLRAIFVGVAYRHIAVRSLPWHAAQAFRTGTEHSLDGAQLVRSNMQHAACVPRSCFLRALRVCVVHTCWQAAAGRGAAVPACLLVCRDFARRAVHQRRPFPLDGFSCAWRYRWSCFRGLQTLGMIRETQTQPRGSSLLPH